jgi:hypothetical protein
MFVGCYLLKIPSHCKISCGNSQLGTDGTMVKPNPALKTMLVGLLSTEENKFFITEHTNENNIGRLQSTADSRITFITELTIKNNDDRLLSTGDSKISFLTELTISNNVSRLLFTDDSKI